MQVEYYFLHKVLYVATLWSPDKDCPVMSVAICSQFMAQGGTVAQLYLHLHCLQTEIVNATFKL